MCGGVVVGFILSKNVSAIEDDARMRAQAHLLRLAP
jgi:hypothetical protein